MARKLSVSEGWYLFAEVCSQNLLFGIRCKYQSRLFGCGNHAFFTVDRWNDKAANHTRIAKRNATKKKNLFPNILRSTQCYSLKFSVFPQINHNFGLSSWNCKNRVWEIYPNFFLFLSCFFGVGWGWGGAGGNYVHLEHSFERIKGGSTLNGLLL